MSYYCPKCDLTLPPDQVEAEVLFGNEPVLLCLECGEPVREVVEWPVDIGENGAA